MSKNVLLADALLAGVTDYVTTEFAKRLAPLTKKIAELEELLITRTPTPEDLQRVATRIVEEKIAELPTPKDGKSVTIEDIEPVLHNMVAALPPPVDGKSVTMEEVQPALEAMVAALPKAVDGKSVTVEEVVTAMQESVQSFTLNNVAKAVELLPRPVDGKSVTLDEVLAGLDSTVKSRIDEQVALAAAALPKPVDGKSVTVEDIKPVLQEMVTALGVKQEDIYAAAIELFGKAGYVSDAALDTKLQTITDDYNNQFAALPKKIADDVESTLIQLIAELPKPEDGKSVTIEDVKPLIEEVVASLPKPADGKSVTIEDVKPLLEEMVAALPKPEDGKSVTLEQVNPILEAMVDDRIAALPKPADGKSVTVEELKPVLEQIIIDQKTATTDWVVELLSKAGYVNEGMLTITLDAIEKRFTELPKLEDGKSVTIEDVKPLIEEAVAALPKPADGKSVTPEDVAPLIKTYVDDAMLEVVSLMPTPMPGDPGPAGKDCLDIEILDSIEPLKSYGRNIWARHAGGIVRSTRTTEPLRDKHYTMVGWECMLDGIESMDVVKVSDRITKHVINRTSGAQESFEVHTTAMIYKDLWDANKDYDIGDSVTYDGNIYMARQASKGTQPGTSKDWRLAVRKGHDHKPKLPETGSGSAQVRLK